MQVQIHPSWQHVLQNEFDKPYFEQLTTSIRQEYAHHTIYPPGPQIFEAFNRCPLDKVKVVLIGQDPYHGPGQAHGLCFSVNDHIDIPPSLRNIYKEIVDDIGGEIPTTGNLSHWADQGVLMLNATLTVRANQAGSHQGKGWEEFTDAVIQLVNRHCPHVVFILWGSYAQRKAQGIDTSRHLILKSAHPSPLSAYRGFHGNHQFSLTNAFLEEHGYPPIQWLK
ncbi:MAG TPA: uracil-DNA glycosylase [Bacteroidaceae bacterium]|nr:uracil-DNA glycosylase [Bacteroidaceae bacterium]